jgi:16S rRNA (uracil1498-N3)-methyltransferase
MKRIFIPQLSESANKKFEEKKFENIKIKIKLEKSNLHYIKNVLRHKNGEEILAFDGQQECLCLLNGENIEIVKFIRKNESQKTLKLAIAQIKAPRLEWLIEKATEIGVTEIFLLETKFTQNKIHTS